MLTKRLKDVYHRMLTTTAHSPTAVQLLCRVLNNIYTYLIEEERKMMKAEAECKNKFHFSEFSPPLCHFLWQYRFQI